MTRRETFLESARAANDGTLAPPEETPGELMAAVPAQGVATELRTIREGLARLERRLQGIEAPRELPVPPDGLASRRWRMVAWLLGGALIAILLVTALRPDWALRPRQRAELALGQRMHRLLDGMEEAERAEILGSLWEGSSPPPVTSD
jgi:hypothetical protein